MIPILAAILVLLVGSAFFSSAETAYFSLSPLRSARLRQARLVNTLLRSRDRLLATILSGNLIVNFAATSLWTTFLIMASAKWGWNEAQTLSLGALVMVLILLVVGEITPKLIAVRMPMTLSRFYAPVLVFFSWIFFPVTWALGALSRLLVRRRKQYPFPTDEEVKTMIEMAVRYGILRVEEKQIMENLVDLGERTVSEVMTPRVEMKAIPLGKSRSQALSYVRRTHKSRYPVYEETPDNVVGILYTKDLLLIPPRTRLKKILREPVFVPETKVLSELLEELRRSDHHIAIAVDEFGGIAGLVTLEDVLESIFGEIVDEYDSKSSEVPYQKLGTDRYLVDGDIDLASLNQFFSDAFEDAEEEFDRLSELLTHELGHIPVKGEVFEYEGFNFTVKKVKRLRIEKVLIQRKEDKTERRN
ncbi:DUF21 domain-containing protein [candidate division WOR-3 bacterium]|nr:DUF21 domain-containing protein [candidate division WOR-3 bacterium]